MPSRSSCSPVSAYRLTGEPDLEDYLVSVASEEVTIDERVRLGDVECRFVGGVLRSEAPPWAGHVESLTGIDMSMAGALPFGVLLIPLRPWTYALTWGAGHHLLDDELVEQGFGVMFGVRRLDADRLGLLASSALDATARATQTSFPGGSDLGGFGIEPYGELVKRLAGPADLRGLTYMRNTGKRHRIRVGNALWCPLAHDPRALLADLHAIGDVVDEPDDHSALRFAAQTRPLPSTHPLRAELRKRLAAALGGDNAAGVLGLAWPDTIALRETEEAVTLAIRGLEPRTPHVLDADPDLDELADRLRLLAPDERLDILDKARVETCLDEDGQEAFGQRTALRKWFAFETTIDASRYCYHQGDWFRIGEGFVDQIRDQVTTLLRNHSDLTFPRWTPTGLSDDEHRFCQQAADQPGYLCLDRDLAHTPFHTRLELCDLVGPGDEIVHVKWLGAAPAASHLFLQAQASAQALRDEPEALQQLNTKITAQDPHRGPVDPSVIVLAAAGREWDTDQLFTLSQLALLRLHHTLRHLHCTLQFANIPYHPKPRSSKPRRRTAQ